MVTGIGGDIGMSAIRCLKEINYHSLLIGCDINEYPAAKYHVDYFFVAPKAYEKDKYLNFVLDICLKYKINFLIPSSEQEIKVINEAKGLFNNHNINILINNSNIINTFMDKYKTIEFFRKNNFIYPKTYMLTKYNGEFGFPFILKLKETSGSKGIFIVSDEIDLQYFKKKYKDAIVQEVIGDPDNEYTIGVFSNGVKTYSIAFKRYLGFGSLSRYVKLVNDEKIEQLSDEIAEVTNLRGSINVQVRKDKQGNYIPFEINPRLSSTVYFRHYFGFEDLKWWIDMYQGKDFTFIPKYKEGIGVRSLGEVFFDLKKSDKTKGE
nr:ATP-grasp domain-containing protein [Aquibacillus albus]